MNSAFSFLGLNDREAKPRMTGLTEIRGPYYSCLGVRQLSDVFDLASGYVDGVKFAGGSFTVMPEAVQAITDLCHKHQVYVSTGGAIERVLAAGAGPKNVPSYLDAVKALGFDVVELSTGFISLPLRDWLNLVDEVRDAGLKPKPEVGIQFGAGGTSTVGSLAAEGTRDVKQLVSACRAFKEHGVEVIIIESEGITEQVSSPRYDVVATIMAEVGQQHVMFEAAEPQVFSWYVKTYGADVNLFVDHSQILQLECLRRGVWGTNDTWGRIVTYRGQQQQQQ